MGNLIVAGIYSGALYAMAGLSLTVIYRSSKVMNFGLGGMGTVCIYVAYVLAAAHVPMILVLVAASAAGAVQGIVVELLIVRPLRGRPPLLVGICTFGVLLTCLGLVIAVAGAQSYNLPPIISAASIFNIGGLTIPYLYLVVVALVLVAMGGLYVLFRTTFGIAMRATTSGPRTAELLGVNLGTISIVSWSIGGLLGGLGAALAAPVIFVSPDSYTTFLFSAFLAVVIGGFTSIGGIVAGSMLYGVLINFGEYYISSSLPFTMTLIALLGLLLVRPEGLFGRRERELDEPTLPARRHRVESSIRALTVDALRRLPLFERDAVLATGSARSSEPSRWWRRGHNTARTSRSDAAVTVVILAGCVGLPWVVGTAVDSVLPAVMGLYIAAVGLNIINGYCRQVTIGHGALVAVGAYATAVLEVKGGLPFFAAVLLATLVTGLVGLLLTIPAARLKGLYLALVTLLFAFAVPEIATDLGSLTGGAIGMSVPLPGWLESLNNQYFLTLAVAVVVTAVVGVLSIGRYGRRWRLVGDSDAGAQAIGLSPGAVKASAYGVGAALAGLGGALMIVSVNFVSPDSFSVWLSVYLLVAITIGGVESLLGCLIGAWFIQVGPLYFQDVSLPPDAAYGIALMLVILLIPSGVSQILLGLVDATIARWKARGTMVSAGQRPVVSEAAPPGPRRLKGRERFDRPQDLLVGPTGAIGDHSPNLLEVDAVDVSYGPRSPALRNVSISVRAGEQVAVLGPNGAGKSTLARLISGQVSPIRGVVRWRGISTSGMPPDVTVRNGIVQVPEGRGVFPDLTVTENLVLARRVTRGRDLTTAAYATEEAVFELFPKLKDRRGNPAGTLSGGEQQMLAIGRGLLADPSLLVLDEPSIGLAPALAESVFETLAELARLGLSMLVIEQTTDLALSICQYAYVLVSGETVTEGHPDEIRREEELAAYYLGVAGA